MNGYTPNTIRWASGDLVLHWTDEKSPQMLMRVIGYQRKDDLCKTRYVFPERTKGIFKNDVSRLLDVRDFLDGMEPNHDYSVGTLRRFYAEWLLVRHWNACYQVGQLVTTTSEDGGFVTSTGGKAHYRGNSAKIWLNKNKDGKGGWWLLKFVKAINA